jgi:hypothetical protein
MQANQQKKAIEEAMEKFLNEMQIRLQKVGSELERNENGPDGQWAIGINMVNTFFNGEYHWRIRSVEEVERVKTLINAAVEGIEARARTREEQKELAQCQKERSAEIAEIVRKFNFPEQIVNLFKGVEATNEEIVVECVAIKRAVAAKKNDLDYSELIECGFDRRQEAIKRVLARAGGGKVKFDFSQAGSSSLAKYLVLGKRS